MKQTLTYNYNKRQSRIITPVKVSYGNKSFVVNALWDTGATYSCITNELAKQLNLTVFSSLEMETAGGTTIANVYVAQISLEDKINIGEMVLFSAKIISKEFDMLIGMDIILQGSFSITNIDNNTKFTFEITNLTEM